jgi:glycosyltransferase involved in cell wall biosynthesis
VEAMATGLPVVASDLPVHREIGGEAALYFERFSPDALAERVTQVVRSPETSKRLAALGIVRARQFSWNAHVEKILELCGTMLDPRRPRP